jgi:uncharacterized protein (TIGR04551 family)
MRSCYSICLMVALTWSAKAAGQAQGAPPPPALPPPPAEVAQPADQPPSPSQAPAQSAPPAVTEPGAGPETPTTSPAPAPPDAAATSNASSVPSPAEMESLLSQQLAIAPGATHDWTAPVPVFTLHGYMRTRGELMDTFWLGRRSIEEYRAAAANASLEAAVASQGPDPFTRFRPIEARPPGPMDCAGESTNGDRTCDVGTLRFANMRLRLSPELSLSEDVRVKMSFDVFDNVILGEPPVSYYGSGGQGLKTVFANGVMTPPSGGKLGDAIKPRRAWAEVRNRNLGELRFGRMPQHWGLGMYYNAGDGLDDDLSTDLDRVVGITKLAGLYLSASYDFIGEGFFERSDERPLEQSQLDDVDQFTFSVARRSTPEELSAAHERGELVINAGVQFSLRHQNATYDPTAANSPTGMPGAQAPLRTIDATHYTTDGWAMLRYRGLRLEGEVAWVAGHMDNFTGGEYRIGQVGYALEGELRLLDDKLGIYLDHGLASGDSSVEGLSSGGGEQPGDTADFVTQKLGDDTVSTFRFHPSYRIDLILWRNIMRQVTGAYYFRPGISYDFVRSPFGQLAGARLDVVWSRATSPLQTWGNDPDLGLEVDVSLYFRTEDGPELEDGFNAKLQYGVLFPMQGLNYLQLDPAMAKGELHTAQTLRLVLGVVF